MTADQTVAARSADARHSYGRWVVVVGFLALVGALPLIGHGCHGDDVDHEPTVQPPGYNQR